MENTARRSSARPRERECVFQSAHRYARRRNTRLREQVRVSRARYIGPLPVNPARSHVLASYPARSVASRLARALVEPVQRLWAAVQVEAARPPSPACLQPSSATASTPLHAWALACNLVAEAMLEGTAAAGAGAMPG